ncbi:hypothetical protein [Bacillus sp. EAC]|uniref:hypothetical protein n=1 Tax=Bacillus sp. EAC TaxID=1978338 RepID=UPI000B4338DB|nr:hypothetical protein [Bacillus sp. EAC]
MKQLKIILLFILASIIVFNGKNVAAEEINQLGIVTGLVAKEKDHKIAIEWDRNPDVSQYVVERNGVVLTSTESNHFYVDENVEDDMTYTYTVYPVGSVEKTSINIYVEKDVTAPGNIRLWDSKKIGNSFIELNWDEPYEEDFEGVYVHFPNGKIVDLKKGNDAIRINNLIEGTSYTYTFCSHDGSGNSVPIEECVKSTNTTTSDHNAPPEVMNLKAMFDLEFLHYANGYIYDINDVIHVTWLIPNIDDYYGAYITLPYTNQKVFVKDNQYIYHDFNNPRYYNLYTFYVQTVDHNGNVSKGNIVWVDHPRRPPGNLSNESVKEKNGVITVSFNPPTDLDYIKTIISLPGGKTVEVVKGKNSYSYKGKMLVGQINEFKLRAYDQDKNASTEKIILIVPRTKAVNKMASIKILSSIRSLPDGKGKPVLSVTRNKKIKILSSDYGVKHNYLYVQIGSIKGYIPKTSVK